MFRAGHEPTSFALEEPDGDETHEQLDIVYTTSSDLSQPLLSEESDDHDQQDQLAVPADDSAEASEQGCFEKRFQKSMRNDSV